MVGADAVGSVGDVLVSRPRAKPKPEPPKPETTRKRESKCPRAWSHRVGVFCKECGTVPT